MSVRSQTVRGLIPAHAGKTCKQPTQPTAPKAHPRSRGENALARTDHFGIAGSSPLTRGKLLCDLCRIVPPGLIPAHAGKTRTRARRSTTHRAHPRSRGENVKPSLCEYAHLGSSPLTRGKPNLASRSPSIFRLIPAHAGKTPDRNRPARHDRAHPRSRGENWKAARGRCIMWGSSPLTRGKLEPTTVPASPAGLIPAHAGKTRLTVEADGSDRAHPRSRGENASS